MTILKPLLYELLQTMSFSGCSDLMRDVRGKAERRLFEMRCTIVRPLLIRRGCCGLCEFLSRVNVDGWPSHGRLARRWTWNLMLADFVKKATITDVQKYGSFFPVPICFVESPRDRLDLGLVPKCTQQALQVRPRRFFRFANRTINIVRCAAIERDESAFIRLQFSNRHALVGHDQIALHKIV